MNASVGFGGSKGNSLWKCKFIKSTVSEAAVLASTQKKIPPLSVNFLFNREVNSGFFYKSAEEREKLVKAERKFIEDRVKKIIELKKKVCGDSDKGFVVINQKVGMKFCSVSWSVSSIFIFKVKYWN